MISRPVFGLSELMAMASGTTHLSEFSSISSKEIDLSTMALVSEPLPENCQREIELAAFFHNDS